MNRDSKLSISALILDQLLQILQGEENIYLVGGAIRDSLLGIPRKDLDFVCTSNTKECATRFAGLVEGNFYTLDKDREIFRVLTKPTKDVPGIFDFASMRGSSIQEDLHKRDFTINAMAADLHNLDNIIDPFHGIRDLQQRKLMPVSQNCLSDDPVRIIRAVRYLSSYQLSISPDFAKSLKSSVQLLGSVSIERIRDEVFKLLEGENLQAGLRLFEHFGLYKFLNFGNSDAVDSTINLALKTNELLQVILFGNLEKTNQSFLTSSFMLQLGRFREKLLGHYCLTNPSGRTRKSVILFAATTLPFYSQKATDIHERFGLSSSEIAMIAMIHRGYSDVHKFLISAEEPDRRQIYRFFKNRADVGVDLIFITLASILIKPACELSIDLWLHALSISNKLLDAWFEQKEVVQPEPILTGNDLMFHFDLAPGPLIGELIESLKEEQAAGNVMDKKSALAWVDQKLIKFI